MIRDFLKVILAGIITANFTFWNSVRAGEPESLNILAAKSLDAALKQVASSSSVEKQVELMRAAAQEALRAVPQNSIITESFQALTDSTFTDTKMAAEKWRVGLIAARDLLRFEPLLEAPLPEGFPSPTPAGEVRLQQYPACRLAQTEMKAIEGQAFMTLFNHIQKAEIAMTAPVEITYADETGKKDRKTTMAFLYRSTDQGTLGSAGKVEVIEVPSQAAVSFGLRGRVTTERLEDARRRLEDWVKSHDADYEACGPLRVWEYNSPFVPDSKRFSEVQIPVLARQPASGTAR